MKHPSQWPARIKWPVLIAGVMFMLFVAVQMGKAGHPTAMWFYCDQLGWC